MSVGLLGVGLAVLSAAALEGQSLAVRWSSARQSIIGITGVVFLVNLLVLLPATLLLYVPDFGLTTRSVAAFAMGGLLGSLLAHASLFVGIERLGTSRAEPLKSTFRLVGVTVRVLAGACGSGLYLAWRRWQSGVVPAIRPTRWSLAVGLANIAYLVSYLAAMARAPVSVVAPIQGASPMLVLLVVAAVARDEKAATARLGLAVTVLVAGVVLVVTG